MTEGILSLSQSKRKHNDAVLIHWGLQIGAGVCIVLGFYSIYAHKTNEHFDHFLTQHANTGLTTIFILFGATIGGSVARYNWIVKKILKPAQMKTIHSIFGLIAYSMLMYTILLGLDTAWFRNQITAQWIQAITYLTWLNMMLVVIKPTISVVKRIQNVLFNGRRQNWCPRDKMNK